MEIKKGIAQESLLHITSDDILFSKTVETKHLIQQTKNILNKSYLICIFQELWIYNIF